MTLRLPFVRVLTVLAVASFSSTAHADPPSADQPQAEDQGPRLLAQVALSWPEGADPDVHGTVRLRVDVGADGSVADVEIIDGPAVFHGVAQQAARELQFAPAVHDGEPVSASTIVVFHFAPITPVDEAVDEVIVHSQDPDVSATHSRTTLDSDDLERATGQDLGETVSDLAGVTLGRGTSDASKPIIRGQIERRLLVLVDGIRHESQKWGPDHATEVDPFSAGAISVIRGAAGARYGPDAIGGVILVEPPPLRSEPGVGGTGVVGYASNGRRPVGALRLDAVPAAAPRLALRVEGNVARGSSLSAPDYVLGNTASSTWNAGATVAYTTDGGQVRVTWRRHSLRAGVFYGVQNGTPTDFQAQLELDRPATADLWSTSPSIDRPYQQVTHDVLALHAERDADWGEVHVSYAFQLNHRQEFEQARASVTGPQYDFTLRTHAIDGAYEHPSLILGGLELSGGGGLQASFQENVYRGLSLLPNHRSGSAGVFAFERASLRRLDLEVGARYDHLSRNAYLREAEHERHLRRDTLQPGDCDDSDALVRCATAYDTASLSVGGLVHVIPEQLDVKIDLSSASRFPDTDELYLIGSAPTFPVYALGSPDLGVETTWGGSVTVAIRQPWLDAEISSYGQLIDDYINFAPELDKDGAPRFDVTARGAFPTYAYRAVDAVFYGADGSIELGPSAHVGVLLRGSLVRAQEVGGQFLVGIPADQLRAELIGRPPDAGPLRDPRISAAVDLVARQTRSDPKADFAPPPPGYALLGLSADVGLGDTARLGIDVHNLLNVRYREATSLLRYYADQPGRDVRVRVAADF